LLFALSILVPLGAVAEVVSGMCREYGEWGFIAASDHNHGATKRSLMAVLRQWTTSGGLPRQTFLDYVAILETIYERAWISPDAMGIAAQSDCIRTYGTWQTPWHAERSRRRQQAQQARPKDTPEQAERELDSVRRSPPQTTRDGRASGSPPAEPFSR